MLIHKRGTLDSQTTSSTMISIMDPITPSFFAVTYPLPVPSTEFTAVGVRILGHKETSGHRSHPSGQMVTSSAVDPPTASALRADQRSWQNGLTDWGYLPDQWQLANVAYPQFSRQRRVNDGGGRMGLGKAA